MPHKLQGKLCLPYPANGSKVPEDFRGLLYFQSVFGAPASICDYWNCGVGGWGVFLQASRLFGCCLEYGLRQGPCFGLFAFRQGFVGIIGAEAALDVGDVFFRDPVSGAGAKGLGHSRDDDGFR